jgi:hypothetical protein
MATYKVVKIISDMELVVNAGSNQGIQKDQVLEIFIPGEEVVDPETNKVLGTLDTIKAYLNVKHVFPLMCICENADAKAFNPLEGFSSALTKYTTKRLNVDSTQISGGIVDGGKIQIGDLVRKSAY